MQRLRGMLDVIALLLPARVPCALSGAREAAIAADPRAACLGVCLWVGAHECTSVSISEAGEDAGFEIAGFACLVHAGIVGSFSKLLSKEISEAKPTETVVLLDPDPDAVWAVIQGAYAARLALPGSCSPPDFGLRVFEAAQRLQATELQHACMAAMCDHGPARSVISLLTSASTSSESGVCAAIMAAARHRIELFACAEWTSLPAEHFHRLLAELKVINQGHGVDVILGALLWAAGQLPEGSLPSECVAVMREARQALVERSHASVTLRLGSSEGSPAGSLPPWPVRILSVAGAGESLRGPLERAGVLSLLSFHEFSMPDLLSVVFPSGLLSGSYRLATVLRRSGLGAHSSSEEDCTERPHAPPAACGPAAVLEPSLAVSRRAVLVKVAVGHKPALECVLKGLSDAEVKLDVSDVAPEWASGGLSLPPVVQVGAVPLSMSIVCDKGDKGSACLGAARFVVAAASADAKERLAAAATGTPAAGASAFLGAVSSLTGPAPAMSLRLARYRTLKAACEGLDAVAAAETPDRMFACAAQHPHRPGFVGTLMVVTGGPSVPAVARAVSASGAATPAAAAERAMSHETWKWLSGTSGVAIVGPTSSRIATRKGLRSTRRDEAAASSGAAARTASTPPRGPRSIDASTDTEDVTGARGKRRKGGKRAKGAARAAGAATEATGGKRAKGTSRAAEAAAAAKGGAAADRTAEADIATLARPSRGGFPASDAAADGSPGSQWPWFGTRSEFGSEPSRPDRPAVMCGRYLALLRSTLPSGDVARRDSLESLRKFLLSVGQFASARTRPDTLQSIDLVVERSTSHSSINALVLCKPGGQAGMAGDASAAGALHCQCFVEMPDYKVQAAISSAGTDFAWLSRCTLPSGEQIAALWVWTRT